MKNIKGFTLVEMMVVVAIIAILSSVFLIGLGSFRGSAYDARRLSDLQSMQAHLEIYFNKYRQYPAVKGWTNLYDAMVTNGEIGLSQLPHDPVNGVSYEYWSDGTGYIIGAHLSDPGAQVMSDSFTGIAYDSDECGGDTGLYCVKF